MPRECSVCGHEDAFQINELLVVEGKSNRRIAAHFGLSESAIRRHKQHIPELLVKASQAEEASEADTLIDEIRRVRDDLRRLCEKAEEDADYRTAIGGQGTLLRYYELLAKVRQLVDERPQINLTLSPQWLELRTTILIALDEHPQAKAAVVRAIEEARRAA